MQKRYVLLGAIFFVFMFAMMVSVSATLTQPGTGATISGTAILNATNSSILNMSNCTFFTKSALQTGGNWITISNIVNMTQNPLNINTTFNTLLFNDSNDYSFNATCGNATGIQTSSVTTGVTIDNNAPTASSPSPADQTLLNSASTQTFSITIVPANTSSCTYQIGRGSLGSESTTGTATLAGSTCSFTKTFSTSGDNGLWYWQITASDGTNSTGSNPTTLNAQLIGGGSGGIAGAQAVASGAGASTPRTLSVTGGSASVSPAVMIGGGIAIVVIIILVIAFA